MLEGEAKEERFKYLLRRAVLLPVVLLLGTGALFTWAAARVLDHAKLVTLSDEIIEHATSTLRLAVDMETGVRGYQVTGSREFLQPYEAARPAIRDQFNALDTLVAVPLQREQLRALESAHAAWAALAERVIAGRARGETLQDAATNRQGKALFDAFRAAVARFVATEQQLRRGRTAQFEASNRKTLAGGLVCLVAVGAVLGWYTQRQLRAVAAMFAASESAAREEAGKARAAAEELRTARDHLEVRVRERTLELQQALAKAQEVDRLKSQFLATMSHELRTPLNSIIGFTEIVLAGLPGELNAEQSKQLEFVRGSAKHLLHLINDLLDLARIESGRVEPAWEEISPREVLDEAVNTVRPLADRKGVVLTEEVDVPDRLRTDRKMFFQVLLNLLGNAIKFTDRGEVRLVAKRDGDTLVTAVRDTGIGIKPEQIPQLFEAFRQIEGSVQRRYEGTGLGLYLCRRIVALLGGTIRAESEFGRGSAFIFTLPLHPP